MTSAPKRHPYSIALQKHLDVRDRTVQGETGKEINRLIYKVHTAGIPGERAVDEMYRRLRKHLRSSTISYDWVVILGGTNDLRKYLDDPSSMEDYTSIFNALVKLHETVSKSGGRTVAVTIPDRECIGAGTCENIKKLQYQINEHLRDYVLQNKGKVILADLAKEVVLPRDSDLFSDWVHFNPQGYDKMADVIYSAMKDYVWLHDFYCIVKTKGRTEEIKYLRRKQKSSSPRLLVFQRGGGLRETQRTAAKWTLTKPSTKTFSGLRRKVCVGS